MIKLPSMSTCRWLIIMLNVRLPAREKKSCSLRFHFRIYIYIVLVFTQNQNLSITPAWYIYIFVLHFIGLGRWVANRFPRPSISRKFKNMTKLRIMNLSSAVQFTYGWDSKHKNGSAVGRSTPRIIQELTMPHSVLYVHHPWCIRPSECWVAAYSLSSLVMPAAVQCNKMKRVPVDMVGPHRPWILTVHARWHESLCSTGY